MDTMEKITKINVLLQEDGAVVLDMWADNGLSVRVAIFATRLSFMRLRDGAGRERLKVEIFEDNGLVPYATTYINNNSLERDIAKLSVYGVFLGCRGVMDVVQYIKDNYNKLTVVTDTGAQTLEVDLPKILRYICGYIYQNGLEATTVGSDKLYHIRANIFSDLIKDSPFSCYSAKDIKQALNDMGYTVCNAGRLDYTYKIGKQAVKAVSFYADELINVVQDTELEHGEV